MLQAAAAGRALEDETENSHLCRALEVPFPRDLLPLMIELAHRQAYRFREEVDRCADALRAEST